MVLVVMLLSLLMMLPMLLMLLAMLLSLLAPVMLTMLPMLVVMLVLGLYSGIRTRGTGAAGSAGEGGIGSGSAGGVSELAAEDEGFFEVEVGGGEGVVGEGDVAAIVRFGIGLDGDGGEEGEG